MLLPVLLYSVLALDIQIVGQTCGPGGCNPIIAPPPPTARAMIAGVSGYCGKLLAVVYLLNETDLPVPNDTALPATSKLNGKTMYTEMHAETIHGTIAPGSFAGPIFYYGELPEQATGSALIDIATVPTVSFTVSTMNSCHGSHGR